MEEWFYQLIRKWASRLCLIHMRYKVFCHLYFISVASRTISAFIFQYLSLILEFGILTVPVQEYWSVFFWLSTSTSYYAEKLHLNFGKHFRTIMYCSRRYRNYNMLEIHEITSKFKLSLGVLYLCPMFMIISFTLCVTLILELSCISCVQIQLKTIKTCEEWRKLY